MPKVRDPYLSGNTNPAPFNGLTEGGEEKRRTQLNFAFEKSISGCCSMNLRGKQSKSLVSQQEPQNSSPQGHTVPKNSAPPQPHFKSLVQPPPVQLFRFEAAFSQGLRHPYFLCYQVCFLLTPSTAGIVLLSFPGHNLQTLFPWVSDISNPTSHQGQQAQTHGSY